MRPPERNGITVDQLFTLLGTDCRENLDCIVRFAGSLLETDFIFYIKKKPSNGQWQTVCAAGPSGRLKDRDIGGAGCFFSTFFTRCKTSGHPSYNRTRDITSHPALAGDDFALKFGIVSCLSVPVSLPGNTPGALAVCTSRCRDFSLKDIHHLEVLSSALALEEKRLDAEIKMTDRLKHLEKTELLGIVAGGVAHDLNNIMSGLVSYPELLLMQIDKGSPLYDPIAFINDAGLKAAEIVQDLLTLTRRGVCHSDVINLNQVAADYFNSPAHQRLEENYPGIRFHWEPGSDLFNIRGSQPHISKVIMNLVMNAAEAVGDRGQISVMTLNLYVDYPIPGNKHIREGEYVRLRVADNGPGISASDRDRIFEPFYTKKQMGRSGSGLGLSVVWNTVKDHGGHIDVTSRPDRGSTFDVYLPATRESLNTENDGFALSAHKGRGEQILVIDDVPEQRRIAEKCLAMLGYTPFCVESGEAAVAFLKKQPVDLLLLDMKMEPGIDGLETFCRAKRLYPQQKAVIASGFSENNRVKQALALGAGQYVRKPYTLKKLALAIRDELATS